MILLTIAFQKSEARHLIVPLLGFSPVIISLILVPEGLDLVPSDMILIGKMDLLG